LGKIRDILKKNAEEIAMSVDKLQEKIRKLKNPSLVELCMAPSELPAFLLEEEGSAAKAYGRFCRELLDGLKGMVPGVRVSFSSFALLGAEGITELQMILEYAHKAGFYVILEAPQMMSHHAAQMTADALWGDGSAFYSDAILIEGYVGSDLIRPFIPYVKEQGKALFVTARTSNKSAPEIQDLLAGSRLVHMAAADYINRHGVDTVSRRGYAQVGAMAAASNADSLKNLRTRYPKLFLLLDGADYPNANAKNCSFAFDKMGFGAAAVLRRSVTHAWIDAEGESREYVKFAQAAAERMKRNLTRYVNIL
jgi:orotidine-5'-phosphate decarboxylase